VGEEELDDYESTLELALVQEYKAVVGTFNYAVETIAVLLLQRRRDRSPFHGNADPTEVTLNDAWVWDMYRTARFVPSVRC